MSEGKREWTPRPWRYEPSDIYRNAEGLPCEFVITGSNEHGASVLPILGRTHNWPDNFEANARLIAAAPDLFEALEQTTALLRDYITASGPTDDKDRGVLSDAATALAKART